MAKLKRFIFIFSSINIVYMILTLIMASSWSVLSADDFVHGITIGAFHVSFIEYLKATVAFTKYIYLNWQGTYFSMFVQGLFSPFNNWGYPQLRLIMTINALLLFLSLTMFVLRLFKFLGSGRAHIKLFIVATVLFALCGYMVYTEIFFWFSGAASYSIPLSLLLIGLTNLSNISKSNKKRYVVLSVILGILAMGGSLTVAGAGCYVAVLVCGYFYMVDKKIPRKTLFVTVIWILAAGVNTIAPGNYIRHGAVDSTGLHPIKCFFESIYMVNSRLQFFFTATNLIFLLLAIFIIGLLWHDNSEKTDNVKYRFFISLAGVFTPLVTAYPVAVGYSGMGDFPNRILFIIDVTIVISLVYFTFQTASFITELVDTKQMIYASIMAAVLALTMDGYGISDIKIFEISKELSDGTYREHYYECKDFINGLSQYEKGTDVRVSSNNIPEYIENIYNMYISDDPNEYVNQALKTYYGFNSFAVYFE